MAVTTSFSPLGAQKHNIPPFWQISSNHWNFSEIHQNSAIFGVLGRKVRSGPKWPQNTYENDKEYLGFWHRAPSAHFFATIREIRENH